MTRQISYDDIEPRFGDRAVDVSGMDAWTYAIDSWVPRDGKFDGALLLAGHGAKRPAPRGRSLFVSGSTSFSFHIQTPLSRQNKKLEYK